MRSKLFYLTAIASLVSDLAIMYSLYLLFIHQSSGQTEGMKFLPWLFYILLLFVCDCYLLRRQVKVNTMVNVNITAAVLLVILGFFYLISGRSVLSYGFGFLFLLYSVYHAYTNAKEKIKPNQMLLYVEFSILIVCFYMLIRDYVLEIWLQISIPIFLILFLNLFSLIAIRMSQTGSGEGNKTSGIVFLAGVVMAILGTSFVFLYWFADIFSGILQGIMEGLRRIATILFQLFNQIMIFLISLLPGADYQQNVVGSDTVQSSVSMEQMEADYSVFIYVVVFIVAIACAIFMWKVWKANKNKRVRLEHMTSVADDIVQKRNRWGILDKLKSFCQKLRYFYLSVRYRNTLCGLYYSMIRYGAKKGMKKEEGATPREYVHRLIDSKENEKVYEQLADRLDAFFFGAGSASIPKEELVQYKKLFQ